MVIETDARRFIVEAIEIEQELTSMEKNFKRKGIFFISNNQEYNDLR